MDVQSCLAANTDEKKTEALQMKNFKMQKGSAITEKVYGPGPRTCIIGPK